MLERVPGSISKTENFLSPLPTILEKKKSPTHFWLQVIEGN